MLPHTNAFGIFLYFVNILACKLIFTSSYTLGSSELIRSYQVLSRRHPISYHSSYNGRLTVKLFPHLSSVVLFYNVPPIYCPPLTSSLLRFPHHQSSESHSLTQAHTTSAIHTPSARPIHDEIPTPGLALMPPTCHSA